MKLRPAPPTQFARGFYEVVPQRALAAADVDAGELELLLLGVVDIDARDWRRHTV